MRLKSIAVLLLAFGVLSSLLFAPLPTAARQSASSFAPYSGPPGTIIYVECFSRYSYYTYISEEFDTSGRSYDITLDRSGRGIIEVPADARPNSEVGIFCYSDIEFPDLLGTFFVTECVLSNADYFTTINVTSLIRSQNAGQRFTGADLGLDAGGLFARTIDLTNAFGENLRLTVRSADVAQILAYLNGLSLDFKVDLVTPSQLDSRGCFSDIGFLSDPNPDSSVFIGDVDVELVLLPSTFVTPGSTYVVSYEIDPELANNRLHTYRPYQTTAASAQVTANTGRVKLTMWNNSDYINAIVLAQNLPKLPALSNSVFPNQATYYSVVRGMDSSSRYTMRGSFGTEPCRPETGECGEVILPQLVLAQGGTGLTNGAAMNDGNFQVEGFCNQGLAPGHSSYRGVRRDDVNWFCTEGTNSYRLSQADFNTICQITYQSDRAVAIADKGESLPVFNWRCYIRRQ